MEKLKYRMYGLVPYNISPIQQGIQFGHAVVEYQLKYGHTEEYKQWAQHDKTFIILNGGTTNLGTFGNEGTLNSHFTFLDSIGKQCVPFFEPDLGDQLTAVVFLVDERVWDREKYPNHADDFTYWGGMVNDSDNRLRNTLIKSMGGEQNYSLRLFLNKLKLA